MVHDYKSISFLESFLMVRCIKKRIVICNMQFYLTFFGFYLQCLGATVCFCLFCRGWNFILLANRPDTKMISSSVSADDSRRYRINNPFRCFCLPTKNQFLKVIHCLYRGAGSGQRFGVSMDFRVPLFGGTISGILSRPA